MALEAKSHTSGEHETSNIARGDIREPRQFARLRSGWGGHVRTADWTTACSPKYDGLVAALATI
jgi:hypothetical protein